MYLKKVREGGGVVSARIAMAAAKGILLTCNRSMLAEFGGPVTLNRPWAYSLLERMQFVQRKVTTAKSKYTIENFSELKQQFLQDVVTTVSMEGIPPELILNWDQTGIKIVPSNNWTMDRQGAKRVEIGGANDKRLITAVFCGSLVGDFLPVQVIYQGKTERCHPNYQFPPEWDITHSQKHWSNEATMIQYIEKIIIPYIQSTRAALEDDSPALVIMDNFKGQVTSLLEDNDIHVCLLPPNTTDRLQPMDVSVNKPAKDILKRQFEEWYSEQIIKQLEGRDIESTELQPISMGLPTMKELGAKWLVEVAQHFSENPQIIVNGFIKAGIAGALDSNEDGANEEGQDESDNEDDESSDDEDNVYAFESSDDEHEDVVDLTSED